MRYHPEVQDVALLRTPRGSAMQTRKLRRYSTCSQRLRAERSVGADWPQDDAVDARPLGATGHGERKFPSRFSAGGSA